MFIHYRTKGVFIRREERGEADILLTVYTEDFGKLLILGKAIRKIKSKLRAGAREFCLSEIEFIQGKSHKTLTEAMLIDNFSGLREDSNKIKIAYQICHVLDRLVDQEQKDDQIWKLLKEVFNKLDLGYMLHVKYYMVYYFFLWNLLAILGYQPDFYKCPICQKKLESTNLYFNPRQGGIICQNCFEKESIKITAEVVKVLRIILKRDWPLLLKLKISQDDQELLKRVSQEYLGYFSNNC